MSWLWRFCFLVGGGLILAGGTLHPRAPGMAGMLADPDWVLSHALLTVGFVAIGLGLVLYRRAVAPPPRTDRWARIALYGTILQTIEMVLHTAAVVDHANLVAGRATPVLSTHMALAVLVNPVFGATFIGLILASARDRAIASPWIAWLGILGAAAHGAAAPLVIVFDLPVGILFPMLMLLGLWLVLAAAWPLRAAAPSRLAETT